MTNSFVVLAKPPERGNPASPSKSSTAKPSKNFFGRVVVWIKGGIHSLWERMKLAFLRCCFDENKENFAFTHSSYSTANFKAKNATVLSAGKGNPSAKGQGAIDPTKVRSAAKQSGIAKPVVKSVPPTPLAALSKKVQDLQKNIDATHLNWINDSSQPSPPAIDTAYKMLESCRVYLCSVNKNENTLLALMKEYDLMQVSSPKAQEVKAELEKCQQGLAAKKEALREVLEKQPELFLAHFQVVFDSYDKQFFSSQNVPKETQCKEMEKVAACFERLYEFMPEQAANNPFEAHFQNIKLAFLKRVFSYLTFTPSQVIIPTIPPVSQKIRGIPNLGGRSCYMNSALQLLLNLPAFRTSLQRELNQIFGNPEWRYGKNLQVDATGIPIISTNLGPNKEYILLALANFVCAYDSSTSNNLREAAHVFLQAMFYGGLHAGLMRGEIANQQDAADVLTGLMAPEMLNLGFQEQLTIETQTEKKVREPEARELLSISPSKNASLSDTLATAFAKEPVFNGSLSLNGKSVNVYVDTAQNEMQLVFEAQELLLDDLPLSFAGSEQKKENGRCVFIDRLTVNNHQIVLDRQNDKIRINEKFTYQKEQSRIKISFEDGTAICYDQLDSSFILDAGLIKTEKFTWEKTDKAQKSKIAIKRTEGNKCSVRVYAKTTEYGQKLSSDEQMTLNQQPIALSGHSIHFGGASYPLITQQTCRLAQSPDFLAVHLKRYNYNPALNSAVKIAAPVAFPAAGRLNLAKFLDEQSLPSQGAESYDITGYIVHTGNSTHSGHYTAYVKCRGGDGVKYYHLDDDRVTACTKEQFMRVGANAYVIALVRDAEGGSQSESANSEEEVPEDHEEQPLLALGEKPQDSNKDSESESELSELTVPICATQ